jgi:hypothetical protein
MPSQNSLEQIDARLAALDWAAMEWTYEDPRAGHELTRRIAEKGRKQGLIIYSELVRGVEFRLPNVAHGAPYTIDVFEWTGLDRAILGSFLGRISADSYQEGGFLATALVVNKSGYRPSDQFFEWMEKLGVLPDLSDDTVLAFWADQCNKAMKWYARR